MDAIWTNQIGYIHLLSVQNWKPCLKRFCVHPSSSPAPSIYFTATQRRKEGVVDETKTDVPSLHAVHIISHGHPTYHVNVIKLKWEIIWKGELPHLSGLPHLPLVTFLTFLTFLHLPHLHVNRPFQGDANCLCLVRCSSCFWHCGRAGELGGLIYRTVAF